MNFAQADDTPGEFTTAFEPATSYNPFDGGSLLIIIIPVAVLAIAAMVGLSKIFKKAGKPMWWAFVPVFNLAKMFEMLGKPAWWGLLVLGSTVPWVGYGFLASALVLLCLANIELGARFGKSTGWSLGFLAVLGFVGTNILGFGKAAYTPRPHLAPRPGQPHMPHPPISAASVPQPLAQPAPQPFVSQQHPTPIAPAQSAAVPPRPTFQHRPVTLPGTPPAPTAAPTLPHQTPPAAPNQPAASAPPSPPTAPWA